MNIIITGVSSGVGNAFIKLVAGEDEIEVIGVSRNAKRLELLRQQIGENERVSLIQSDITNSESKNDIIKEIERRGWSSVDVLINNAGNLINKDFGSISLSELRSCYEVNVFAPFILSQTLLPYLKKDSESHIINIGSMGGVQGSVKFSGLSAYSSSKGAIAILTECLAEELKETNIKINCIALGAVQTEMLEKAFPGYQAPFSSVDIARYILDFCLGGGKFMNGKIIPLSLSTP